MSRKVAQIGPSTLMVSLPSKWTKQYHIRKGDELNVTSKGNTLIYATHEVQTGSYGNIQVAHPNLIKRYVNSLYRRGYDEAKIICDKELNINTVMHELNELLGFELIEHGNNYFIVKNISESINTDFDKILNRIFLVNISFGRDCLDAIEQQDHTQLEHAKIVEKTNNKLTNLCLRILNKKGYTEPEKTTILYAIVTGLERIADYYRDICQFLLTKKKIKINTNILSFFKETNDLFEYFYHNKYKIKENLHTIKQKRQHVMKKHLKLLEKSSKEESVILSYLSSILKELAEIEFVTLDLVL